jgi:hypothetical protein
MDSTQTTKLDLLPVMATPASIGVLLSVLMFVALLVGPKTLLNALFNVSPYRLFLPAHMSIPRRF